MLQMLLDSMFSAFPGIWTEPKKDDVSVHIPEAQEKSECAPVVEVKKDSITADIKRLEEALGHPLVSGDCIDITLQNLLKILPRERKRTDTYNRLVKRLAGMGITLKITSRKKHGKKKD